MCGVIAEDLRFSASDLF